MQTIRENIKNNNCRFEFCRNYEDGKCLNETDRKNCLDIAMAVLCINEEDLCEKTVNEHTLKQ